VETAFDELAKRWRPILDAFDAAGVDVAFESIPARICMTGRASRCSSTGSHHPRCNILYDPSHFVLQQLDY